MGAGEGTSEAFELSLGEDYVFALPSIAQRTRDARMQFLGQMIEDVSAFMLLAALYQSQGAEHFTDRPSQGLGAIDHPKRTFASRAKPMDNTDMDIYWRKEVAAAFAGYALKELRGDDMRQTRLRIARFEL